MTWEQTRDRLLGLAESATHDGDPQSAADIRAVLERVEARDRRIAFMEGVDEREGSGWCGEHPRMFSLRPDAEADGECLMCANAALCRRVEELERALKEILDHVEMQNADVIGAIQDARAALAAERGK